jgi:hypothetical protein
VLLFVNVPPLTVPAPLIVSPAVLATVVAPAMAPPLQLKFPPIVSGPVPSIVPLNN